MAPLLSMYAQHKKIDYFLKKIPRTAKILEIGSGSGWVGNYLRKNGYLDYTGNDIVPPADIVGDIHDYKNIGLTAESYDVIIAFEVVEHVNCIKECYELLAPGGRLMLTSPVPHMDWFLKILEFIGLNQKRTSPHDNLNYFRDIKLFSNSQIKIVGFLSQWGIFVK
jgi:2-polyprenyl-3-methyl-5-hydroxy-6-metoxy-1,4-benzoquinol methylase